MLTLDFETKAIAPRPDYPPEPVGLAYDNGTRCDYVAWGHPTGNNCWDRAAPPSLLRSHWRGPLLMHNCAFDLSIAHERLGLPLPNGSQVNDTMFLAFLLDPYGELGLKPLAERYLNLPPTERDAVREWLQANYKAVGLARKPTPKQCGAHISLAPGDLVRPYALGDVERTRHLFDLLMPMVEDAGMLGAYRRECAITPMLLDNSAQGIPIDHRRLKADTKRYEAIFAQTERQLRMLWPKEIGGPAPANFDSGDELAEALERNPAIRLPKTPTGRTSTAKDSLMSCVPDGRVKGFLLYRSAIEKCLSTYMRPWLAQGKALHCSWNQVRNYDDDGARTGRLSSSPNLQNITNPEKYEQLLALMKKWDCDFDWVTFPNLRSYIVAPKGMVLFSRDYSQQELRMLAHYEDGTLAEAYRNDPDLDLHTFVSELILKETGVLVERKPTKTINFAKIYGAGRAKLAAQMGVDVETGNMMVDAYEAALPSVKALQREVNAVGKRGEYITTLGGRRYYSPPAERDAYGGIRTFEYKLLNYLIQGSSADQTKEAMRLWWDRLKASTNGTRFLLTVHDQLVGCCTRKDLKREEKALDACMREAFTLDVPVKSDLSVGVNFGNMEKVE